MSTTAIVGVCSCATVVYLSPVRLNIVSTISSVVGNSIDAIALLGTSILCTVDDIVVAAGVIVATGGGGGSITVVVVVVVIGACIVAAV